MPTVEGRDGTRKTVGAAEAERLLASGYWITYNPTSSRTTIGSDSGYNTDGGFGFTIYDSELGFNRGTAAPAIQDQYDDYRADWGVAETIQTTDYGAPNMFGGSSQYQDNVEKDWKMPGLTAEEEAIAAQYITRMGEVGGGRYWDIVPVGQRNDGSIVFDWSPLELAMGNIEQDGQDKGWSDSLTGSIQNYLRDTGPNQGTLDGIQEGLMQPSASGSGSGSSGRVGPVYVGPDRGVVEDTVKSMLTSLTGDEPDEKVQEYTDLFLSAHKESWSISQTGGEIKDPNQTVLEAIRTQDDYQRIHKDRAESDSETRWISDRVQRLGQLGMNSADADERAVWLAQTGTNLNEVDTGAIQNSKGAKDITLMNKISRAASNVAGQL